MLSPKPLPSLLSALAAGFKNVFFMGDHGDEQDALRAAATDLEDLYDKLDKTAHVYYVPDLYFKEKQQMKAYLAERGIRYDPHAGTDDTSEVRFSMRRNGSAATGSR